MDKISLKQIEVISDILCRSTLVNLEFIKKRYLESSLNFEATINFLYELKLITLGRNSITPKPEYKVFLRELRESTKLKPLITEFMINHLLNKESDFSENIDNFLFNVTFENGQYELSLTTAERLKFSGLRNFLMELGLIYLDHKRDVYIVDNYFLLNYVQLRKLRHVSLEEFSEIQRGRDKLGYEAELRIIEYEKNRLSQYPDLAEQIEHTSQTDIAAGYDIKSIEHNEDGMVIPRFIEVKAVSPWDFRFYWTKNEIETSRLYKSNYYLYLLPIQSKNKFNIESLITINNPFMNIYQNTQEWVQTNESISFARKKKVKS